MYLDTADFPFTRNLEESFEAIRSELLALTRDKFMVFPERQLYESGWDVFPFYAFGRKLERNCQLCPETTRAVETIPGLTTASFSRLEPGTHIKPHVGYQDTVLRCHLALIVPENCALRVGPETRAWEPGKCLVFDDTTEHEAWNRSEEVRIVLIIDFTKPGVAYEPPGFLKSRLSELDAAAQRGR
jgi:ornithine lipid ester-linked acyl 2-hydroxylase